MKVLLVEDNEVTTMSMTKLFKSKGIAFRAAANLEQVKDALENNKFTHLLCDYLLGDENGLEAVLMFKEAFPRAAVAMFTGDQNFMHQAEVRDFLTDNDLGHQLTVLLKPLDQAALMKWISTSDRVK